MSETTSPHSGLTRRSFLKTTGATVGALALGSAAVPSLQAVADTRDSDQGEEQIFHCVCQINCSIQNCGLQAHVRDGKLVKTSSVENPTHQYYDRRGCLRGRTHPLWVYHADRVKYPLKRVGERGSGDWERISWEQAIDEIGSKCSELCEQYGHQALVVPQMTGSYGLINGYVGSVGRFANAYGATLLDFSLDLAMGHGFSRVVGGSPGDHTFNMKKSNVVWCWAANVSESRVQSWHHFADAKEAGCKLVTVDPRYSVMAQKSDIWVPLKPGTDSALILSMMNVIFDHGKENREFMADHTVAPFLVREDDAQFLRANDLTGEEARMETAAAGAPKSIEPYMVWDAASGKAIEAGSAVEPAFEGSFEVNGITVRPAFQLLKDLTDEWPPEKGEEVSGVPAEQIVEIADLFADSVPNFVYTYLGTDRYDNADMTAHSLATLSSIMGNVGISGASMGQGDSYGLLSYNPKYMLAEKPPSASVPLIVLADIAKTGTYMGKDFPVKILLNFNSNVTANMSNGREMHDEVLPLFDLVVTHDSRMTETARYSDYVLPATHYFETVELENMGTHFFQLSEKAIDPLYEAKSNLEVVTLLARKMGFGEYFERTEEEIIDYLLDTPDLKAAGITQENLRKEHYLFDVKPDCVDVSYGDLKFKTDSGRLEFYSPNPKKRKEFGQTVDPTRHRLPYYNEPFEIGASNELRKKYPLTYMQEHARWHAHTTFGKEITWLRELDPEPLVKLARQDAESRGILDGDIVKVFNDRGYVVIKAQITDELPAGMVNIQRAWQRGEFIEGSYQDLTHRHVNPMTVNQSFCDALVEVEKVEGGVR